MARFHDESEFRRALGFARVRYRYAQPNRAEQLILLLGIVGDKAGIACTAPTLHVASKLRPPQDVSRWCSLALGRLQALIQRLPENWFIRSCERPNRIIHSIKSPRVCLLTPPIIQYTRAATSCVSNLNTLLAESSTSHAVGSIAGRIHNDDLGSRNSQRW